MNNIITKMNKKRSKIKKKKYKSMSHLDFSNVSIYSEHFSIALMADEFMYCLIYL